MHFSQESYGANYFEIVYWLQVSRETGELIPEEESEYGDNLETEGEEETIAKIDMLHQLGYGAILQLYPEWYGSAGQHSVELGWGPLASGEARNTFREQMLAKVGYWAQIAQDHGVEIFAPTCELIVFLPADEAKTFYTEIAQTARQHYSGEIAPKTEIDFEKYDNYDRFPEGTTINNFLPYYEYTGYDYVGADLFGGFADNVTDVSSYQDYVDAIMSRCETLEGSLGLSKIVCLEVGFPDYFNEDTATLGAKSEIVEALFERAEGRADGLILWNAASLISGTDNLQNPDLLRNVIKPLFEEARE